MKICHIVGMTNPRGVLYMGIASSCKSKLLNGILFHFLYGINVYGLEKLCAEFHHFS